MPTLPMRRTLLVLACMSTLAHARADTVIDNANGYTLDAHGKVVRFTALAFDDAGKLLAVGSAAQVKRKAAKGGQAGEREQGKAQGQVRHFHLQVFKVNE